MLRRGLSNWLPPAVLGIALVGLWQAVVEVGWVSPFTLPPPSQISETAWEQRELLWGHTVTTATTSMAGFLVALALGMLLAILMLLSRRFEAAMMPLLVLLQVVPKVAIAPLLIIFVGYGSSPKVVLAALLSFFPLVIGTSFGLKDVPPDIEDLVAVLQARPLQRLAKVRLPSAVPHIAEASKVAITLAIIGSIVGEFSSGTEGLGYVITSSMAALNVRLAFAAIVSVSLLGLVLFTVVSAVAAAMNGPRRRPSWMRRTRGSERPAAVVATAAEVTS